MAGDKSCEGNVLHQCVECGNHRVIKNGIDGNRCESCGGYLVAIGFTNLPTSKESKSLGSLHVDIDCADALKGLKAIQREAKKATAALKELEGQRKKQLFKREYMCERVRAKCPKCSSTNTEIIEVKSAPKELYTRELKCLDCGHMDVIEHD